MDYVLAEIFYKPQGGSPYRIMVESTQNINGIIQQINKFKIGKDPNE